MAVPAPLTADQLDFYRNNGYLLIDGYLDRERCNVLATAAEGARIGPHAPMLGLHNRCAEVLELLRDPEILAMADQIQGARMIPIGSIYFFCKPGNPLEQGSVWHQDNYAVKAPPGSYFVCSVAFDDADAQNGALEVVPGTHLLGELPNVPSKNFEFNTAGEVVKTYPIGNAVELPAGYQPVTLTYAAGSLIFLHSLLIHGAPANPSPTRWRRQIYLHYIKDGDPFWPGWSARRQLIERTSR
jgi:phytanoyl-CoA hydroxylase